ncbi:hypothetical protein GF402_01615 [Candidatus Fermentibacteria bacterium]|nr:hypothetical protein [Candidatus Fermentibacteria bacterium]
MSLRIEKILMGDAPPLSGRFEMEPASLNLVYGRNEKGKTLLVEAMLKCLFRSSARESLWSPRDWQVHAEVLLSGLSERPVPMSPDSEEKLEDYWSDLTPSIPGIAQKLMVVKGAEAGLTEEPGGAGRGFVRRVLSSEDLLEKLDGQISSTLKNASISDGIIEAWDRGVESRRREKLEELRALDDLLEKIDTEGAGAELAGLEGRLSEVEDALREQLMARRHLAWKRTMEVDELKARLEELPDEQALGEAAGLLTSYSEKSSDIRARTERLEKARKESGQLEWLQNAVDAYEGGAAESRVGGSLIPPLSALAFFALATAVLMLAVGKAFSLLGLGGMLASGVWLYLRGSRSVSGALDAAEMEKLGEDFQRRFGREMGGLTDLRTLLEQQKGRKDEAVMLEGLVDEDSGKLRRLARKIRSTLGVDADDPSAWRKRLDDLRKKRSELSGRLQKARRSLDVLGVSEEDLLEKDPGTTYDAEKEQKLEEKAQELRRSIQEGEDALTERKARIMERTGEGSLKNWEELLGALRDMRERTAEDYRELQAEVVAKIVLHQVLRELSESEDQQLRKELASKEMSRALLGMTGRYRRIALEEGGLKVFDQSGGGFDLASVSTGAREQILLAVRVGLLERIMGRRRSFLILDDAFQHSDWERRRLLVDSVMSLVEDGWQVFYLTMDDHLDGLLSDAGRKLGDSFVRMELS